MLAWRWGTTPTYDAAQVNSMILYGILQSCGMSIVSTASSHEAKVLDT